MSSSSSLSAVLRHRYGKHLMSRTGYALFTNRDQSYTLNVTQFVRVQTLSSSDESIPLSDFQSIVCSRRTAQKFLPLSAYPKSRDPNGDWIIQATTRAIQCAVTAPNHYRTEPTTYLRIHSSSRKATALTDILYEVTFRRQLKNLQQRSSSMNEQDIMSMDMMITEAQNHAVKKQQRWNDTICTYIIVLVQGQTNRLDVQYENQPESKYDLLPYRLPQTERQLEDYASACASMQNLLLSLHSEGLACKWSTPTPLTHCQAFRSLIDCQPDDLVVGVVMVGLSALSSESSTTRLRRRLLQGDTSKDL